MLPVTFHTATSATGEADNVVRRLTDGLNPPARMKITLQGIAVDLELVVGAGTDPSPEGRGPIVFVARHADTNEDTIAATLERLRGYGRGVTILMIGTRSNTWDWGGVGPAVAESTVFETDGEFSGQLLLHKVVLSHVAVANAASTGWNLAPRKEAFRSTRAWASAVEYAASAPAPRVVPVLLSKADASDAFSSELSDAVTDRMLVWFPNKQGLSKDVKGLGARALYHTTGGDYAGARKWLAELGYGILADDGGNKKFDEDRITKLLDGMSRIDPGYVLVPWKSFGEMRRRLEATAAGASVHIRQTAHQLWERPAYYRGIGEPVWTAHALAVDRVRASVEIETEAENSASSVPLFEGMPQGRGYIFSMQDAATAPKVLGSGGFGCVLRLTRGGDGRQVAVKVQGLKDLGEEQGRHEVGLMQYAQKVTTDATRTSPFVQRIYDGYMVNELGKLSAGLSSPWRAGAFIGAAPGLETDRYAAIDLARAVAGLCDDVDIEAFEGGMIITETPIATGGEITDASARHGVVEDERIVWVFELVHGLVSMHNVFGFVHNDVKAENILMFNTSDVYDKSPPVVRVRTRDPTTGAVDDFAVRSTEGKLSAVFVDFGASFTSSPGPEVFGPGGPRWAPYYAPTSSTAPFLDPTFVSYYDTGREGMFLDEGPLARGIAGDVWALGLALISTWLQNDYIISKERPPEWGSLPWKSKDSILMIRGRSSPSLFKFESGMRGKVKFGEKTVSEILEDEDGEPEFLGDIVDVDDEEKWSHLSTFLHSIVLYKAFHKKWPSLPPDLPPPGPFWNYVQKNKFAELEAAFEKDPDPFEFIANRLEGRDTLFFNFVKRCLSWDPRERAAFFTSGEVFRDELFKQSTNLEFLDPSTVRSDFFLDLTTRADMVVEPMEAPSIEPPPGTPTPRPVEPVEPKPKPKPKSKKPVEPKPKPKPEPEPEPKKPVEPKPKPKPKKPVDPVKPEEPEACPRPDDPGRKDPVPAELPEPCQEIRTTRDNSPGNHSVFEVIKNLAANPDENSLYVFDFDDTLATRVEKVFPNDDDAEARLHRAVDNLGGQIVMLGNGYYGPANIADLAKLGGRVVVLTSRDPGGMDDIRTALASAGLHDVETLTSRHSSKAAQINALLDKRVANIVHFVDNSQRHRDDVRENVKTGANALYIYDVSLRAFVRGVEVEVEVVGTDLYSPIKATDRLSEVSGPGDVYILDFHGVIAAHELEFVDPEELERLRVAYNEDWIAQEFLDKAAEKVPGITLIGELTDPKRDRHPKLYGPDNLAKLGNLPGETVFIINNTSNLVSDDFIQRVIGSQGVPRAKVVRQMESETKVQTVARILADTPARTAYVLLSENVEAESVSHAVTGVAKRVELIGAGIVAYVGQQAQRGSYDLLERV